MRSLLTALGFLCFVTACMPAHLAKYRKNKDGYPAGTLRETPSQQALAPVSREKAKPEQLVAQDRRVLALDGMTYRFQMSAEEVWDSLLNVLIKNYNLAIVDKESGVVSTDWDSFYLDDVLYRNKVSIRLQKSSYRHVDVAVRNSVEKLQTIGTVSGLGSQIWVPTADKAKEVSRIVQNMSILLGVEPPSDSSGSLSKLQDNLELEDKGVTPSY